MHISWQSDVMKKVMAAQLHLITMEKGKCEFDDLVNEAAPMLEECDGLVIGSPVYYASATATLIAFLTRLFYSTHFDKTMKAGNGYMPLKSKYMVRVMRSFAGAARVYGIFALFRRDFFDYISLKSHFVFFDCEEPCVLFFLDYGAIIGLTIFGSYYIQQFLKGHRQG